MSRFYLKLILPFVVAIVVFAISQVFGGWGLGSNAWMYASIFAGLVVALILEPIASALIGVVAVTICAALKSAQQEAELAVLARESLYFSSKTG